MAEQSGQPALTLWKHNNFHCGSFFSYFQIVHSIFKINQAPALPIGLNLISFFIGFTFGYNR